MLPPGLPDRLESSSSNSDPVRLTELPDEVIAKCYTELPATDLVTLEHVSTRLRTLIATDSLCWKRCVFNRWQSSRVGNSKLLASASLHAGGWKQLYAEKSACDAKHSPWLVVTDSEIRAIVDIIAGPAFLPVSHNSAIDWQSQSSSSSATPSAAGQWSNAPMDVTPATTPVSTVCNDILGTSPVSVLVPCPALTVAILIDASSSVTPEDFACMKNFTSTLVSTLRNSSNDAHMCIIQFNQHPRVELPVTDVTKPKVNATIDGMEQLMGSTDIAAPIRRARQVLTESAPPGDRVIVLLTDGQTHAEELVDSQREARRAVDEASARVYTLGVGRDVDETGLARIAASSPVGGHFTLRRFYHGTRG